MINIYNLDELIGQDTSVKFFESSRLILQIILINLFHNGQILNHLLIYI